MHLPEPGEYGVDVFVSQPGKKRSYCHACQYLVLYLADDEKTPFVSEISTGVHGVEEAESELFTNVEKEVRGNKILLASLLTL